MNKALSHQLVIANNKLVEQNLEREKRSAELAVANRELEFQNLEKEKRASELVIANAELEFQNREKAKREAELVLANIELEFQNREKAKREAELVLANIELEYQNQEKEKRAAELVLANIELEFQNNQKIIRASELIRSNRLYAFISQINQNIVRVKDQETLFKNACAIAIQFGRFKIAWIGLFRNANKMIECVEHVGIRTKHLNYFRNIQLTKNGPQMSVLEKKRSYINNDIRNDAQLETRELLLISLKIRSCIILPIKRSGVIIGTFNLFANELSFFTKEEIALLDEVTGDISFALDIFEKDKKQRETEALIEENEKRFRALIEKSADMIALSDPDGKLLFVSNSFLTGLGYPANEMLGTSIFDIIHPDDMAGMIRDQNLLLKTPGKSMYYQQRRRQKKGSWIWCEGTLTNLLHEPGINALVSNFRDVSEKKIREEQREYDRNNMKALINNTNDLKWSVDLNFDLITSNEPFNKFIKQSLNVDVFEGESVLFAAYTPEQRGIHKVQYERALGGEAFTEVFCMNSPVEMCFSVSYFPIINGGKIIGTACHSRDITENVKAEETLKQSELSLRKAQAIAHIGNFEIDLVTSDEVWSDQLYEILGTKRQAGSDGETFSAFIHPEDVDSCQEAFNALVPSSLDYKLVKKNGVIIYVNSEWKFEFDSNRKPIRLYGIVQDITERKLAEIQHVKIANELMLRNKELEQFAYIISHNLRAPVANIIGATNALNDADLTPEDKEILGRGINKSVMRLDEVVRDLNHIIEVKGEINEIKEAVLFADLVEHIKASIQGSINEKEVQIEYDFSEIGELLSIRPYLYSIFYNLISNSIKYRRKHIKTVIKIKSRLEKNKLELSFSDNGLGIDLKKHGDLMFGLYKRFHSHTEGKGMGLFMTKTQVEAMDGKISVKSVANEGTEFAIAFNL